MQLRGREAASEGISQSKSHEQEFPKQGSPDVRGHPKLCCDNDITRETNPTSRNSARMRALSAFKSAASDFFSSSKFVAMLRI